MFRVSVLRFPPHTVRSKGSACKFDVIAPKGFYKSSVCRFISLLKYFSIISLALRLYVINTVCICLASNATKQCTNYN